MEEASRRWVVRGVYREADEFATCCDEAGILRENDEDKRGNGFY